MMDLRIQPSYSQILSIALPISLALLVPQINFITNNIFLGGLGTEQLAAAGITGVYYLIFAVVGSGLNSGVQALIARRAGQNKFDEIGKLFYQGTWLALFMAVIGIGITYLLAPLILRSFIHNLSLANQAIDFLLVRIWGLPFLYLYVLRNAFLVGTQQTKFLVWGTLAEASVNIFLDYGLIYGKLGLPAMGFQGAALASLLAEVVGLLVIQIIIYTNGLHKAFLFTKMLVFDPTRIKLILDQSAPLILQFAISILSWEFFYILIEHHGTRDLAISNAMRNIFGFFGIFCWAFASTTNTMVSNLIGQGKNEEVFPLIRKILRLSMGISVFLCVLINGFPTFFLSFYGQDQLFISEGIPVVRVVSFALLLMSCGTIWLNAVTGTGNSKVNLFIELVSIVFYSLYVYVVLEYLNLSIVWGWLSEWVYWISMFTLAYFYMRSGKWKGKTI
jgi:multidrug resistance protein, MATE family